MMINIAAFISEPAQSELLRCTRIREETLAVVYQVPGYTTATRDTRNFIYDNCYEAISRITL